ncbi:hypothetical protein ACN2AK_09390 [Shewanella xiamenensis]|uniref:hypothetical protein n=1 Tax=Shewanella xiamenensis TaxID=332186 RepID=UPI0021BF5ACB|nr:hypothetical protein [Shewanella xiamenensis]MCT8863882.1 hypothetical protein [Shewanella xiamenensis]UWH43541.1 hypothetical protein KXJ80_10040 [Shewanella xiamenensis]
MSNKTNSAPITTALPIKMYSLISAIKEGLPSLDQLVSNLTNETVIPPNPNANEQKPKLKM